MATLKLVRDVATAARFSGFLDHGHRLTLGVVLEMSSSSAVTFCWCEHNLPLASLSSIRTCVG